MSTETVSGAVVEHHWMAHQPSSASAAAGATTIHFQVLFAMSIKFKKLQLEIHCDHNCCRLFTPATLDEKTLQ